MNWNIKAAMVGCLCGANLAVAFHERFGEERHLGRGVVGGDGEAEVALLRAAGVVDVGGEDVGGEEAAF